MWNRVEGELSFHKPEWFAPLPLSDGLDKACFFSPVEG